MLILDSLYRTPPILEDALGKEIRGVGGWKSDGTDLFAGT